jgi:EAL domain-containing protein (putative c-di-GMP-specific phosphodiesterase class I)
MQEAAILVLEQICANGVRGGIDDFGTGHSSLGHLRHFPVDQFKIDQSFAATIGQDPSASALFGAVVQMAHSLRLRETAESVESDMQWHYLRALDRDAAQGS